MLLFKSDFSILPTKEKLSKMLISGNVALKTNNQFHNKDITMEYAKIIMENVKTGKYSIDDYISVKRNLSLLDDYYLYIYRKEIINLLNLGKYQRLAILRLVNKNTNFLDKKDESVADISKIIKIIITKASQICSRLTTLANLDIHLNASEYKKELETIYESCQDKTFMNQIREIFQIECDFLVQIPQLNQLIETIAKNINLVFENEYKKRMEAIDSYITDNNEKELIRYSNYKKMKIYKDGAV